MPQLLPAYRNLPLFFPTPSAESVAPRVEELVTYEAPTTLGMSMTSDVFEACAKAPGSKDDCAICMDHLYGPGRVVRLKVCGHEYNRTCIKDALNADPKCPVCHRTVQKQKDRSPSGTMTIATNPVKCSGFEPCARSILITYSMPSCIQKSYHENPGQRYQGPTRNAYLPDDEDGRKLLKRLKNAWIHGLVFTIGTLLTTRQPNCITWASIRHKTSPWWPSWLPGFQIHCEVHLTKSWFSEVTHSFSWLVCCEPSRGPIC